MWGKATIGHREPALAPAEMTTCCVEGNSGRRGEGIKGRAGVGEGKQTPI